MLNLNANNFSWEISSGNRGTAEMIVIKECGMNHGGLNTVGDEFKNGQFGDDVFQVFLHYIYRKTNSIPANLLEKIIEFSKKNTKSKVRAVFIETPKTETTTRSKS